MHQFVQCQLLHEARAIVLEKCHRRDDLLEWVDTEVESGNCEIARMPKSSLDGEVFVYKSDNGKTLMTMNAEFAKKHICTKLFPAADIVVGIFEDRNGSSKFVPPTIGNGHTFNLASSLGEMKNRLRIKVNAFDANGAKHEKKLHFSRR